MLDDLLDIVERLAASQFKNHLDINEGIFGMLEKHIEIKSPLKHLKEGESLPVVDKYPPSKIIDKLGLSWAKLSSSWDWSVLQFSVYSVSLDFVFIL